MDTMTKSLAGLVVLSGLLIGCAQTPNDISLTVNQSECVTASYPGYESQSTEYSAAFPLNGSLPANSPYCAAVTIKNSNSGTNANNIQVNSTGLVVSYSGTGNNVASSMIDYNAAGIPSSSFNNTLQQLQNVALFDPSNCVTTQGSKVNTLGTNGNTCTFFLQLVGESLPVGMYPLSVTLNYTNGNSNYAVSTTINQRVNLYLGGNFSGNIAISNAQSGPVTANVITSANSPESSAVSALTRDLWGNVYSGDIFGNVYKYTGTALDSWIAVATGFTSSVAITALTTDGSGNLYVANALGQLAQVTPTLQVTSMGILPTTSPTSMQVTSGSNGSLLISAGNLIYSCSLSNISATSCSLYTSGPDLTINQMVANNTVTIATNQNVYQYTPSVNPPWSAIASGLAGQDITTIAVYNSNTSTPVQTWYAGVAQIESSSNSAVYSETSGSAFAPQTSTTGAILAGAVKTITTDTAQGLFVGGVGLNSTDFSGQNAYLAYIPSSEVGAGPYNWTPITGISGGGVTSLQPASQLTSY